LRSLAGASGLSFPRWRVGLTRPQGGRGAALTRRAAASRLARGKVNSRRLSVPSRPVIGIATQTLDALAGERPAAWVLGQAYVRALTAAGAVPWLVPLLAGDEATLREVYDRLDGVFLAGGVDVDPAHYGEARHPRCDRGDADRDWTEFRLVRWAAADGKPLL